MGSLDLMRLREAEIGGLVQRLAAKSASFTKPKLVMIGGYALRAYLPFSRYSRDCDFVLKEGLETVRGWRPQGVDEASFEDEDDHGFLRWAKPLAKGRRTFKVGVDFMRGQVRTREGAAFVIDDRFLERARESELRIGDGFCRIFIPSYPDLFVMKVVAGRSSDVRDIAALVWKNGVPEVKESLASLNEGRFFFGNLREKVIPETEDRHFLNSWRGTFVTSEFGDKERGQVVAALRTLPRSG